MRQHIQYIYKWKNFIKRVLVRTGAQKSKETNKIQIYESPMSVHVAMPVSVSQSEEKKSMASLHNRSAGALDQLFGFRTCIGRYCITSTVSKSFLKARVLSALQLCTTKCFVLHLTTMGHPTHSLLPCIGELKYTHQVQESCDSRCS